MPTPTQQRHQWIHSLVVAAHADKTGSEAMNLWEQLSSQLISLIGEGGFSSIYGRSVLLSQSSYPWLQTHYVSSWDKTRFGELNTNLQGQTPELACAANGLLLTTFTDILVALIGEPMTDHILRSAWGPAAANTSKEIENA